MGILNFLTDKKADKEIFEFPWIPLTTNSQLFDITNNQNGNSIIVFKHSTRCGISSIVLNRFEKKYANYTHEKEFYLLDILNYRSISNEIALHFEIIHQSPQLLIFKNGIVKKHASHYDILVVEI